MSDIHFEILPPAQKRVWDVLAKRADELRTGGYYLAGGTALALHLGHRQSVDFDFFSQQRESAAAAMTWLEEIADFTIRDRDRETIHGNIEEVKLSLIGAYRYPLLEQPSNVDGVQVAGPLDIGVMKLIAITNRATVRDYIDIAALVRRGWELPVLLQAGIKKYGPSFNPMVPLRTLTAFADLEDEMPVMLDESLSHSWKEILQAAVRQVAL